MAYATVQDMIGRYGEREMLGSPPSMASCRRR